MEVFRNTARLADGVSGFSGPHLQIGQDLHQIVIQVIFIYVHHYCITNLTIINHKRERESILYVLSMVGYTNFFYPFILWAIFPPPPRVGMFGKNLGWNRVNPPDSKI